MGSGIGRAIESLLITMTGNYLIAGTITVATSATTIPLGSVTSPGYSFFLNKDSTNFIRIMNGSGGAKVPKLRPGQVAIFPWDDTATPYAQADTASCAMEYMIISL